jgi:uncharacterized membrane protein YraQ (UPF0718 family)
MAFTMGWGILWALILGFAISATVQAVVSTKDMVRVLGDDRPKTLAIACGLGAASSSCSYAAVAIARSLFRKGAHFTAAMAFELASTNLVVELTVIMVLLLGWQFAAAEFIGAPIMVAILALLFRRFLTRRMTDEARAQADRGLSGRMEGHAEMHMEVVDGRPLLRRLVSAEGRTAVSHYFVMDWASVWLDIVLGLLIAGALAVVVPSAFWNAFFLSGHPGVAKVWGPLVGPLVAIVSFVCSVGNVPLAAVLWNSGISFGGVIAFIFADLIILPILDIYRRYYGRRMSWFLLWTFYVAMAGAAYIVELLFGALGLIPATRSARVMEEAVSWNYTTWLNIGFLVLAAVLAFRFLRTGGPAMLRMMNAPAGAADHMGPGSDHAHRMV